MIVVDAILKLIPKVYLESIEGGRCSQRIEGHKPDWRKNRFEIGYFGLRRIKYTYVYASSLKGLAHKTVTISEEAYNALARMKGKNESFTEVILRIARRKEEGTLLDYVKSIEADDEFAGILEEVVEKRRAISLRAPRL